MRLVLSGVAVMLYIASALKSTAVTHSAYIPRFLPDGRDALVVAKGNVLEVWRGSEDGLVEEEAGKTEVWGMVVGMEWVGGEVPHVVVMTDHPLARMLLFRYSNAADKFDPTSPGLVLTDSFSLTPTKFTAEFYTGLSIDRQRGLVLASLYSGVLGVFHIGESDSLPAAKAATGKKSTAAGKRKSSAGKGKAKENEDEPMEVDEEPSIPVKRSKNLVFKEKHEVPTHIYNLLSLAFLAAPTTSKPITQSSPLLAFLYVTPEYTIELVVKSFNENTHEFKDFSDSIDVLSPPATYALPTGSGPGGRPDPSATKDDFACPGASKLLALPPPSNDIDEAQLGDVLVIGDEFSVAYTLRNEKTRTSSTSTLQLSPTDVRTSPETKRRKGSAGGSLVPVVGGRTNSNEETTGSKAKVVLARQWRVRQGFGEVSGATTVAGTTPFVILGDKQGRLSILAYPVNGQRASASFVGTVSPPSCISYLAAGLVYIGSESGDCQIVRLEVRSTSAEARSPTSPTSSKGKGKASELSGIQEEGDTAIHGAMSMSIIDSWANIAPVKDFCVVSEETSGDGGAQQIVTASGQASGASIRVIRSGVGSEELIELEGLADVVGAWPIYGLSGKRGSESGLLVSAYDSTTILRLSGSDSAELDAYIPQDYPGIVLDHPTLKAGNIDQGTIIQVTPYQVRLISCDDGRRTSTWSGLAAGEEIVLADYDGEHVVLGLAKAEVIVLKVEEGSDGLGLAVIKRDSLQKGSDTELACISLVSRLQAKVGAGPALIVGYWGSNHLHCVDLSTLIARSADLTLPTIPHSACVRTSGGDPQLFVGLGDGGVVSYSLVTDWTTSGDPSISFGNRKVMQVGTSPVTLSHNRATDRIVAVSDRIALLAEEQGRVSFAPLNIKNVSWATYFELPSLGDCLLTATSSSLTFTRITSLKKLHIKKIGLDGYMPVAVAFDESRDTFGVAAISETIDQEFGDLVRTGSFHIMNHRDQTFSKGFDLESGEEPICLEHLKLGGLDFFALGTMFPGELDDAGTSNKGYLHLIRPEQSSTIDAWTSIVVGRYDAPGCVQDVKAVWDKVAIAVDYGVDLLNYNADKPISQTLSKCSTWRCASKAAFLSVQRKPPADDAMEEDDRPLAETERLHVGDSVKSVYVLELVDGKLCDVARDYMQNWVVAMEELEANGGSVIISDLSYNVKTLTFEDGKVQNAGAMALHELVTKFQRGSISNAESGGISAGIRPKPEVVFATSSGTIGIVADIEPEDSQLLSELQLNMDGIVKGPMVDWRKYRELHSEGTTRAPGTAGFLDGNFLQRYLDIVAKSDELSERILRGPNEFSRVGRSRAQRHEGEDEAPAIGATKEEVVSLLESLATLH